MTLGDKGSETQDGVNRRVWERAGQVARFAAAHGWMDPSEHALVERVMKGHNGATVLDIGVGGGRTVPLFAGVAAQYIAVDFIPALVTAAQRRFPKHDIRVGDARDLDFPDASFDVAMFSSNGLDTLSHSDRKVALHEIRRVLRPNGVFIFSTHNAGGPGPRERPWGLPPMTIRQPRSSARSLLRRVTNVRTAVSNYRRLSPMRQSGRDWKVTLSGAHDFGLLVHYTTEAGLRAELAESGFSGAIELWDDRAGLPIDTARPVRRWWYFNVLARCSPDSL